MAAHWRLGGLTLKDFGKRVWSERHGQHERGQQQREQCGQEPPGPPQKLVTSIR